MVDNENLMVDESKASLFHFSIINLKKKINVQKRLKVL